MLKKLPKLSKVEARNLVLAANGLGRLRGVTQTFRALGYVQMDTIQIVERAHHHVIWSRDPKYTPVTLMTALNEKKSLFEYWTHAAAFLPMEDFRFSLVLKNQFEMGARSWFKEKKKIQNYLLSVIRAEGPKRASDFETEKNSRKKASWWEWSETKKGLAHLFMSGALMACRNARFERVYDLTERFLPGGINCKEPTLSEYASYLVWRFLNGQGLGTPTEMAYLSKPAVRGAVCAALVQLTEEGVVTPLQVEDQNEIHYALTAHLAFLEQRSPKDGRVFVLSPFDNLTIQRKRLKKFFDYSYTLECYVPEAKRKKGYFVLPLLYGDRFIGGIDAKAYRPDKRLVARWVDGETKKFEAIRPALLDFARFNGCTNLELKLT